MTAITNDHVEWAVVGRLRLMLEEPPHENFNVTQSYALFTTVLAWVMQRIRIRPHEMKTKDDGIAHGLLKKLEGVSISEAPWRVHVTPAERIERIGQTSVVVSAPKGFEEHTAGRFLINLRDSTAHGDARNVSPFNINVGSKLVLAGFSFRCAEFERRPRGKTWNGEITLLESDMRRIGAGLAKMYCDAIRRQELYCRDGQFGSDAASVGEVAA